MITAQPVHRAARLAEPLIPLIISDETISFQPAEIIPEPLPAPDEALIKYEALISRYQSCLFAGCGDYQNPLHLARRGFECVDAFDMSQSAARRLGSEANRLGLRVDSAIRSPDSYSFAKSYDMVMSTGFLHLAEKRGWRDFLYRAKENTNPGGLHIIEIRTSLAPSIPHGEPCLTGLADEREILDIYSGWDVLGFKSLIFESLTAYPRLYSLNRIAARKI